MSSGLLIKFLSHLQGMFQEVNHEDMLPHYMILIWATVLMGTQTQGKNPTFLLPKHCNPTITQNPRLFQVSEFPSKSPIFYSRSSKKALIFLSKITLETFRYEKKCFSFQNYFFFKKISIIMFMKFETY